ncbi:NADPH-dependent ferric siderophore reductase [Kocuria sp. AG109]|nr:NADPH-dependent ferric siderophore reductase [Kocuria sp. AG109]
MAQHRMSVHPLVVRTVRVLSVQEVTPRMRRIRLGGEQLSSFVPAGLETTAPAFRAPSFDDHVKLIFAENGPVQAVLPRQLSEGIEWTPASARITRDYTPRAVDADAGELTLDFVLHGHGPAAAWARAARPGDELSFVGPKFSMHLPAEISAMLLVGDETALPAIGRFFDERPVQAPAHAVITVSEDAARQELALREGDSVTWVRKERPDGPGLLRAVRETFAGLELGPDPFLWAAGEARSLLPLRRWASRERVIPKTHQSMTGYWHVAMDSSGRAADAAPGSSGRAAGRGQGGRAAGAAQSASGTGTDGPRGGRGPAAPTTLPVAPVAWFAVAAAVQTGLLDALADAEEAESAQGPEASPEPEASQGVQNKPGLEGAQGLEAAQIAEAAGLDAALLFPLLDLLAREGLLTRRDSPGTSAPGTEVSDSVAAGTEAPNLPTSGGSAVDDQDAADRASAAHREVGVTRWSLTELGRELVADEHQREGFESFALDQIAALTRLPQALRGGASAWRRQHGEGFARSIEQRSQLWEEMVERAATLPFLQHPILRVLAEMGAGSPALVGPGAEVLAGMLADREQEASRPEKVVDPSEPVVLTDAHDADLPARGPPVVSVLWLSLLDDTEALAHLRALRRASERAVVIDAPRPDELAPSAAVQELMTVALTGAAPRSEERLLAMAREAGFSRVRVEQLGWGKVALRLSA